MTILQQSISSAPELAGETINGLMQEALQTMLSSLNHLEAHLRLQKKA